MADHKMQNMSKKHPLAAFLVVLVLCLVVLVVAIYIPEKSNMSGVSANAEKQVSQGVKFTDNDPSEPTLDAALYLCMKADHIRDYLVDNDFHLIENRNFYYEPEDESDDDSDEKENISEEELEEEEADKHLNDFSQVFVKKDEAGTHSILLRLAGADTGLEQSEYGAGDACEEVRVETKLNGDLASLESYGKDIAASEKLTSRYLKNCDVMSTYYSDGCLVTTGFIRAEGFLFAFDFVVTDSRDVAIEVQTESRFEKRFDTNPYDEDAARAVVWSWEAEQ